MPSASIPAALATTAIATSVIGGGVGAIGAIKSSEAQAQAAQYQAQVAANNEKLATQNAALTEAAGSAKVEDQGIKTRAQIGAIEAAQAASNIAVGSGSALDVRSSTAETGQLDALTIRSNAEKIAYGYKTQAEGFQGQQSLEQEQAKQATAAGALGAAGSILSGISGAASQYTSWQRAAGPVGGSATTYPTVAQDQPTILFP